MEEYNIGKEIKEEMRKQGMTVASFAAALHRERQTVYDMFNRTYIATDRLMEVSRLLKRDFFKEMSDVYKNGSMAKAEEEAVVKERISLLMPEDELHIIRPDLVAELADEYFLTPRTKPLMVVCDRGIIPEENLEKHYDGKDEIPSIFHQSCKDILGEGMIKLLEIYKDVQSLDCQIDSLAALPQKVIEICFDSSDYDKVVSFAEKLVKASGKFVVLYWNHINELRWNEDGSALEWCDELIKQCFNAWHERIHMFVADNKYNDYFRRQELYHKSMSTPDDILFQAQELLINGKKEEAREMMTEALKKKIYDLHEGTEVIASNHIRKAFTKKCSFIGCGTENKRICIRHNFTNEEQTPEMKELLRYHLIGKEDVGFWFDKSKEDDKIINWKYNKSNLIRAAWGIDNTYTLETKEKNPAEAELLLSVLGNLSKHNFKKKTLTLVVPAESVEAYRQYPAFAGKDVEFVAAKWHGDKS